MAQQMRIWPANLGGFTLFLTIILACSFTGKLLSKKTMFEGLTAQEAADAFKNKLGSPVMALSLQLERDMATLRVQDPKNPSNVDEYKYGKGILVGPTPVQLTLIERNLTKSLFDLDEVNLSATEGLARAAVDRTGLEGGGVTEMMIRRGLELANDLTSSGAVQWLVTVEGTREKASAMADAKGNIWTVDLSGTSRAANWSAFSAENLREAAQQIKQALGGKVRFFEIIIYERFLMFTAISPSDNEVIKYKFDINGVTKSPLDNTVDPTPISVRQSRRYKPEQFLFDIDDVKLELAPELGKKALARLNFSNGRINTYVIRTYEDWFKRRDLVTRWEVSCVQGRKSEIVFFDLAGNEINARPPS